jgi:electron transport complex protein RnfE
MNTESQAEFESSSIWHNNSVLVQLLGLSPVLAISTSMVNGLALGVATLLVTVASCTTTAIFRGVLNVGWRLVFYVAIIGCYVTVIDLLVTTYFYPLSRSLGIYLPLIGCNAAIIFRMESFSRHAKTVAAFKDSVLTGAGFLWVIFTFAAIREWTSTGDLFSNAQLLIPFREGSSSTPISTYPAMAKFIFPSQIPGAFIILGLILAGKNLVDRKLPRSRHDKSNADIRENTS